MEFQSPVLLRDINNANPESASHEGSLLSPIRKEGSDILLATGSCEAKREGGYRAEEGDEQSQQGEYHGSDSTLLNQPSASKHRTSSQSLDLTGNDETLTSTPLCKSTRDKQMSL
eukprot:10058887-Ditylum_brightwellii.AAC.2